MHYSLICYFSLNKQWIGLSANNSVAASDFIDCFFLRFHFSLAFFGLACTFDGFVGYVWVNCTSILTTTQWWKSLRAESHDITHLSRHLSAAFDGSDYLEVQSYKAVDLKSCLNSKPSPNTEVIEQEQVIEMLDKPIMVNHGQIMLSRVSETHKTV